MSHRLRPTGICFLSYSTHNNNNNMTGIISIFFTWNIWLFIFLSAKKKKKLSSVNDPFNPANPLRVIWGYSSRSQLTLGERLPTLDTSPVYYRARRDNHSCWKPSSPDRHGRNMQTPHRKLQNPQPSSCEATLHRCAHFKKKHNKSKIK